MSSWRNASRPRVWRTLALSVLALVVAGAAPWAAAATPKVVVISLDGATPRFVKQYLADGTLSPDRGLGLLITSIPR